MPREGVLDVLRRCSASTGGATWRCSLSLCLQRLHQLHTRLQRHGALTMSVTVSLSSADGQEQPRSSPQASSVASSVQLITGSNNADVCDFFMYKFKVRAHRLRRAHRPKSLTAVAALPYCYPSAFCPSAEHSLQPVQWLPQLALLLHPLQLSLCSRRLLQGATSASTGCIAHFCRSSLALALMSRTTLRTAPMHTQQRKRPAGTPGSTCTQASLAPLTGRWDAHEQGCLQIPCIYVTCLHKQCSAAVRPGSRGHRLPVCHHCCWSCWPVIHIQRC